MTDNERIRRELSFGLGSKEDISDTQFRIIHHEPSYGHGGIPQSWDMVVQDLFCWPHGRQKLAAWNKRG